MSALSELPRELRDLAQNLKAYSQAQKRRRALQAAAEIERLQDLLFARGAMDDAPCFCCGYNGPGYFNPGTHPCAKRHHALSRA